MADELGLSTNGFLYEGWQDVAITRSIEQVADSFTISYVEDATPFGDFLPIEEGDLITLKTQDEIVVTGFVDSTTRSYAVGSQSASVTGRSVLGDIVDCAARIDGGQWRDQPLSKIADDVLAPFDISKVEDPSVASRMAKPFRRFALQYGETVFQTLERAARMRGILMVSNADGELVFTQAGVVKTDTILQRGVNIKSGSLNGDWTNRFSEYRIKAQTAGDDSFFGEEAATKIVRTSEDDGINRYRPTDIMAENEDTGDELQERVDWERNVRTGVSRRLSYEVEGWRDDDGALWTPNTLVRVDDDRFGVVDELLIVAVRLNRSLDRGFTSTLELTAKEAFDVRAVPPARQTPKSKKFFSGVK